MSASPIPSRRQNNLNGRSRSPSPAANSNGRNLIHNPQPTTTSASARENFLNPANSNLYRARRSIPTDSTIKENATVAETIPLIDVQKIDPPLANPEIDDFGDDREIIDSAYPGVDDGFFSNRLNPDGPTIPGTENVPNNTEGGVDSLDDADGGRRIFPSRGVTPNPMSPDPFGRKPIFPDIELGTIPDLESIPDVNVYQHKKTLAQGMMDLALFSANANQLRYVLESNGHAYYYPGIVLISISLVFQVAVGVGLIWNSRYNVKDEKEICIANKINNFTIIGIFLVTVINVFISAFGVASVQPAVRSTP